jgi:hypothetical protein
VHGIFQRSPFAPEFPRAVGIFPDAGFPQLQFYLGESILAQVEVKDTP